MKKKVLAINDKCLCIAEGLNLIFFDIPVGNITRIIDCHKTPEARFIDGILFLPKTQRIITTDQNHYDNINVWNFNDGSHQFTIRGHANQEYKGTNPVSDFVVDDDEKYLISGGADEDLIRKWDLSSGKLICEIFNEQKKNLKSSYVAGDMSISPDGLNFCFVRNDSTLICCATKDLKENWRQSIKKQDGFFVVKWHPNGNSVFTSTISGRIIEFNAVNGKIIKNELYSHGYIHEFFFITDISSISQNNLIPDEEKRDLWLISCDSKNSVVDLTRIVYRLWNWSKKKNIVENPIDIADMTRCNISKNNSQLIIFSQNILIYQIMTAMIIATINFSEPILKLKENIPNLKANDLEIEELEVLNEFEKIVGNLPRFDNFEKHKLGTRLNGVIIDAGYVRGIGLIGGNLTELPKIILKLPKLIGLWLTKLQMNNVPDWIGDCIQLKYLYLNNNNISQLPSSINSLINLDKIDLSYNSFMIFPEILLCLTNISDINLSNNNIEKIPDSIYNLKNLKILRIYFNQIKSIPIGIKNLKFLQYFSIFNNLLELLPDEIGELIELEVLLISYNKLKSLPNSISALKKLKTLELDNNLIEEFPSSFKSLQNLEIIDLRGNPIKKEPNFLLELPNLKEVLVDQQFNRQFPSLRKKLHGKGIKI